MIRVEVLFPEIANLYGDLENISYLKRSCSEIEVVEDSLVEEPHFMTETPDLIYLGTLTEHGQEMVIEKLAQYKDKLVEMINAGVHFLFTGNALEIMGREINDKNGTNVKCLNIFPIETKREMMKRFNSLYLGKYDDITIVGYKSQFTHSYWTEKNDSVFEKECGHVFVSDRGPGLNPDIKEEGIRMNNFLGTYIIGPLLVLNPPFTKALLKDLGAEKIEIAFEKEAMEAYDIRVKEYSDENTGFYY